MTGLPEVEEDFGTFRIVGVVGSSATGRVYTATRRLGRVEALKVLSPSWMDAEDYRARFLHDIETLVRLDSPHVVDIFGYGDVDGTPYVSTEFAHGGDLGRYQQQRGRLPAEEALGITSQVASALEDAHAVGVVHGNLKPSNVLFRREGDPFVLLCDFAPARSEPGGLATTVAPWAYLAPERSGGAEATASSDIYAVGCLLWTMLAGQAPYRGTDLAVATGHLHDPIPQLDGDDWRTRQTNQVLARMLAKAPEDRYATAGELHEAVVELLDHPGPQQAGEPDPVGDEPTEAVPVASLLRSDDTHAVRRTPPLRAHKPGTRRLALVAAGVLVVGTGAVLLGRSMDTSVGSPASSSSPSASAPSVTASESPSASPTASTSAPSSPSASPSPSASASPARPQNAAQLARLTRAPYQGGARSVVALRSLDSTGGIETFGLRGRRSVAASTWQLPASARGGSGPGARVNGDFDGDRRTDLAIITDRPGGQRIVLVARSTDKGFAPPRRWGGIPRTTGARISTVAGDFDGDGRMDLAVGQGGTSGRSTGVTVLLSTGTRFRAPTSWATRLPWDGKYVKLEPGDFNADGRTDLAAFVGDSGNTAVQVRMLLSDRKRFTTPARSWFDGNLPTTNLADIRPLAGDFNGDGSTDVMVFAPEFFTGNLEAVFLASDRRRFTRADVPWWTSTDWGLSGTRMSVGDFDGNGRSDVACLVDRGKQGVDVRLLMASGSSLRPGTVIRLPKRSLARTGVLDASG